MDYRVFISYRRKSPALAQWLSDKLSGELGTSEVFLDVRDVETGTRFPERLRRAIESAPVFISVIGHDWNPYVPGNGRLLDDPNDFVRREVVLALECATTDSRRLILPVLDERVEMPSTSGLPVCMKSFADIQAFSIASRDYANEVGAVVERVVAHLDGLDTTLPEERWVVQQITHEISSLAPSRIVQIGQALKRTFPNVSAAPESARALARVAYRLGPAAFGFLLALEKPVHRMESILELLATNWIDPEEAAKLRRNFGDAQYGRRVAIECKYVDFTPHETLLKASGNEDGWSTLMVTVKPSDQAAEIIEQIHAELSRHFDKALHLRTSIDVVSSESEEERLRVERDKILVRLERRRVELGGQRLPFVLRATLNMARHKKLLDEVQGAFPPLHILIATDNTNALADSIGTLADVVIPSDDDTKEEDAVAAYIDAHESIASLKRRSM
jgi:hypothetical protein